VTVEVEDLVVHDGVYRCSARTYLRPLLRSDDFAGHLETIDGEASDRSGSAARAPSATGYDQPRLT
jgi:hypothetical protein